MKRLLFLFASLALTATSCSTEEPEGPRSPGGGQAAAEGNLRLVLSTAGIDDGTRAAKAGGGEASEHQTPEEKKVTKLNVYVFDATTGLLEVQKEFVETEGLTEAMLPVSTGRKSVVALANYATPPKPAIGSDAYSGFTSAVEKLYSSPGTDSAVPDMDGLKSSSGYLMSGRADVEVTIQTQTQAGNNAQDVPIELTRYAAKVSLINASETIENPQVGKFSAAAIKRGNIAVNFYRFQQGDDSNWTTPPIPAAGEGQEAGYYTPAVGDADWSSSYNEAKLFAENKPAAVTDGNGVSQKTTSYILIKGTFTPLAKVYGAGGASLWDKGDENGKVTWSSSGKKWTEGQTFYRVWLPETKTYYDGRFYTERPNSGALDAIKSAANDNGAVVVTFTNAVCYYRVWLTDNLSGKPVDDPYYHAIRRNQWFQVNMASLTDCGMSTEDGKGDDNTPIEPEKPVEPTQDLTVRITVEPWEVIDQNTPLG